MTVSSILDWEEVVRPTPPGTPPPPPPPAATAAAATPANPNAATIAPADGLTVLSSDDVSTVLGQLTLGDFLDSQHRAFKTFAASRRASSAGNDEQQQQSQQSPEQPPAVQTPLRISLALENHTTLFMPASLSPLAPSIKIVSVPSPTCPSDVAASGLPGTTLVLDAQTGKVKGVVNASELTGVRTAAGSAVASLLILGKGEGRERVVVFGGGVQAFWHTHLHLLLFPTLKHVSILARPTYTSPDARTAELVGKLRTLHPGVEVEHSCVEGYDRGQAVHNADLILCCTPSTEPLFPSTQPRRGTHLSLIGSYKPHMREVSPELLASRTQGVVYVDGEAECRAEAGELQGFEGKLVEIGSVGPDGVGQAPEGDLTVWKSVGLGVQDVAITDLVFRKAKELGLGQVVAY